MKKLIINWAITTIRNYLVKQTSKTKNKIDDVLVRLFDEFVVQLRSKS